MGLREDFQAYLARLGGAIDGAMQQEVADAAKQMLADAAQELVYDAYEPEYYDRWGADGGLLDTSDEVMRMNYDPTGKILEITDDPDWHDIADAGAVGIRLSEAVETGQYMYGAGARPFHAAAEERMGSTGAFSEALMRGLRKRGFE